MLLVVQILDSIIEYGRNIILNILIISNKSIVKISLIGFRKNVFFQLMIVTEKSIDTRLLNKICRSIRDGAIRFLVLFSEDGTTV